MSVRFISLALFSLALGWASLFGNACAQAQTVPNKPKIPVLKINRYYVPFLAPDGPSVDVNNQVIIPVVSFCHAVGIQVSKRAGSLQLSLGGQNVSLPRGKSFVPLRALLDDFAIPYSWDAMQKRLTIADTRLMKTTYIVANPNVTNLEEYIGAKGSADGIEVLSIMRRSLRESGTGRPMYELKIAVKNASGADIIRGEFKPILMTISKKTIGFAGANLRPTPDNPYRPYPAIKAGDAYLFSYRNYVAVNSPTEYMIFLSLLRKDKIPKMNAEAISPQVTAVSRSKGHSFSKENQDVIRLLAGLGVEGDAHCGATVKHRSRVKIDPTQPNLRQVHVIHSELHDELRRAGFDVSPGVMGENITTRGIDLLRLPTGTRLHFGVSIDEKRGETAVIEITGLRNPCAQLDDYQTGLLSAVLDRDADGNLIRKAGIMGIVLTGGEVRPGDAIRIELPPPPHRPLERV